MRQAKHQILYDGRIAATLPDGTYIIIGRIVFVGDHAIASMNGYDFELEELNIQE